MLEAIENLLILQDRDRNILRARAELADIEPQRRRLQAKLTNNQAALEAAKLRMRQLEADRKELELEVDTRKQQIEKYSLQQFQTKKNEEYRALTHEIDTCKDAIVKLDDQQLELMVQAEQAQNEATAASRVASQLKKEMDDQIRQLDEREQNLSKQLSELESNRDQLAESVEPRALARYQRLSSHKGENVVVGIAHGVCGGCHMKLPVQILVSCQGDQELVSCPNCGRILYYTHDMDLAFAD